jgi:uncharacterized protein (TIGR02145 family)
MKKPGNILICVFILSGMSLILTNGCKKATNSPGPVPVVITDTVSTITATTAACGGIITNDGGSTVTTRGVCWSTGLSPTIGDSKTKDGAGAGNFTSILTGLTATTTYYVRAYATNSNGTGYGSTMSFMTSLPTITDIDGNIYHAVTIGTQVWMVENLKTTRYNDGSSIPYVEDPDAWIGLTSAGYSWPEDDPSNITPYGAMYNWYAVNTGKLAPTGWHVPTNADWTTLINFAGGEATAGGKLKAMGTLYWAPPNTGATDAYGFSALPAGYRSVVNGTWVDFNYYALFWSATDQNGNVGRIRLQNDSDSLNFQQIGLYTYGFSVRCIKN